MLSIVIAIVTEITMADQTICVKWWLPWHYNSESSLVAYTYIDHLGIIIIYYYAILELNL